jgi:hypothetical protein
MYRECGQRTNAHDETGDGEREREKTGAAANGDEKIRGGQRRGVALVCQPGTGGDLTLIPLSACR